MGVLNNLPLYYNGGAYDSLRNRWYFGTSPNNLAFVTDTNPSTFASHGAACANPNPPTLMLTQSWTRAWIGDTLEVTVGFLPLSMAFLAMGFSDQTYGATPLPLNLANYGMPGCQLHVAPDATRFAIGANNATNFQLAIPNSQSLLGVTFGQQVLAPFPGANPADALTSASIRGTVGRAF